MLGPMGPPEGGAGLSLADMEPDQVKVPVNQWWTRLDPATQAWLIDNNGDSLSADIAAQVTRAGGTAQPGQPLPDGTVDWIEAVANGELPD